MKQVAPLSFSPLVFLLLSASSVYFGNFPIGAALFAWLAGIQLLNTFIRITPFHWLHAMTFEIFALLGVAILRFLPAGKTAQQKGRPILLVHGYINNGSVWWLFKRRLEALGFGPVYTVNLGHPFRSIESYTERVKAKVEEIRKETARDDLILIGHSMGGLVASLYASLVAAPNTVTDVITIASPLHGTPVAYLGLGPNAKEMRPSSALLEKMREGMRKAKGIRFFHIATKTDQLVIPGHSAILDENPHVVFEDVGHASLLYSKRTLKQIAQWL